MLENAPARVRERFRQVASPCRLPEGRLAIQTGDRCPGLVFPARGRLRVFLTGADGREITLYRVEPGQGCVLSAACVLADGPFPAMAVVEEELEGWLIPAAPFREWVRREDFWMDYVFRLLNQRLATVLARLEDATFGSLEQRMARCVIERLGPEGALEVTQQELADEIGSAREAVNRVLRRWQDRGWVRLGRGRLEVLEPARLRDLARGGV